jgi:hypothetical protein
MNDKFVDTNVFVIHSTQETSQNRRAAALISEAV